MDAMCSHIAHDHSPTFIKPWPSFGLVFLGHVGAGKNPKLTGFGWFQNYKNQTKPKVNWFSSIFKLSYFLLGQNKPNRPI